MQRNSDLLTAKKDQNFQGFFSSPQVVNSEMPASIRYEYIEMKDFIDNIDNKVSFAKNVNQDKLKNKVLVDLNRLNREERIVQKLEEKLAKQGIEVNESSMIKKDLDDLQSLQIFSDSLKNTSETIQSKINTCQERINELNQNIKQQKLHLRQTNSQIMENTAKKESLLKSLKIYHKQSGFLLGQQSSILQQQNHNSGMNPFQSDMSTEDHYLTSVPENMLSIPQNNNNNYSIVSSNQHSDIQNLKSNASKNNLKYKKLHPNSFSTSNLINKDKYQFQNDNDFNQQQQYQQYKNIKPMEKSASTHTLPPLGQDPVQKIHLDVRKIKEINEEIKNYFLKKSNAFIEMKRIVYDCFASQRKRVLKQHKISNNQGLADSMLFEMGNNNGLYNDFKSSTINLQKQNNLISQTRMQDRELRNVLYETIKHIKATKVVQEEEENNQDVLQSNQISYSEFSKFTQDQILALLMVKPELLQQLLTVFDIKEKAMNLMILKAKFIFNRKNQNITKLESLQQQQQLQNESQSKS